MAVSLTISEIFSVKEWPDLEIPGLGSFKVTENAAVRQNIYDLLSVGQLYLVPFASYLTLNNIVILKVGFEVTQRSLKLVPFESFGAVSDSPSIVTVAVSLAISEVFSVKEWHGEIWVWGCSSH